MFFNYSINYNLNGGKLSNPINNYKFYEEINLPEANKDHYIFEGWVINENDIPFTKMQYNLGDKTLIAKFVPEEYTINFYVDNEPYINNLNSYEYNKTDILLPHVDKDHHIFSGWIERGNESATPIFLITKGSFGNKEYDAVFEPKEYKLNYILNGGYLPNSVANSFKYGEEYILPTPSKNGYKFLGWYLDENFEEKINKINPDNHGNKTLYASWQKVIVPNKDNESSYTNNNSSDDWRISSGIKVGGYQSSISDVDLYDDSKVNTALGSGAIRDWVAGSEYIAAHASSGFGAILNNNTLYIKRNDNHIDEYYKVATYYGATANDWVTNDGIDIYYTHLGDLITQTCTDANSEHVAWVIWNKK